MYFYESNFIKCIPKIFCPNESIKGLYFLDKHMELIRKIKNGVRQKGK